MMHREPCSGVPIKIAKIQLNMASVIKLVAIYIGINSQVRWNLVWLGKVNNALEVIALVGREFHSLIVFEKTVHTAVGTGTGMDI